MVGLHAISILCGQWCIAILFNVVFLCLPGIRFPKQIISLLVLPALLHTQTMEGSGVTSDLQPRELIITDQLSDTTRLISAELCTPLEL